MFDAIDVKPKSQTVVFRNGRSLLFVGNQKPNVAGAVPTEINTST